MQLHHRRRHGLSRARLWGVGVLAVSALALSGCAAGSGMPVTFHRLGRQPSGATSSGQTSPISQAAFWVARSNSTSSMMRPAQTRS